MTEEAPGKRHHAMSKFLNKNKDRWKEKLASNLAASTSGSSTPDYPPATSPQPQPQNYTLSDDVADFLRPSTSKARPVSPKAPRIGIDVAAAQKWAANANPSAAALDTPSILRKRDHPRRALNLVVQFSNALPDVIGEGGDECEEPVIDISTRLHHVGRRRHPPPDLPPRQPPPPQQTAGATGANAIETAAAFGQTRQDYGQRTAPDLAAEALLRDLDLGQPPPIGAKHERHNSLPTDEPEFVPKPIKRTQTSFNVESDDDAHERRNAVRPSIDSSSVYSAQSTLEPAQDGAALLSRQESSQKSLVESPQDTSPLQLRTTRLEDLRFGGKRNSLSSPVLQEKIYRMRAEEGKALHSAVEQDPFLDNFGTSNRVSTSTVGSIPQESSPRRSISQGRPSAQFHEQSKEGGNGLHSQTQMLPTPSPGYSQPPPPMPQQQAAVPQRKPLVPAPINSQLRPSPLAQPPGMSPRISPSLNVTIPDRTDYFQPPHDTPATARAYENGQSSRVASNYTSPAPPAFTSVTAPTVRSASNATPGAALGQLALDDFADRCSHMGGIFRLQAEFDRPVYDYTPSQWIRAATWWFLRGRTGIENIVRSRPRSVDGRSDVVHGQELLTQPHVDLAKAWWILVDVMEHHPALLNQSGSDYGERSLKAGQAGDVQSAELFESCEVLVINLKSVLASMKRNGLMPPTHALIQGQDQTIWIRYPELALSLRPLLAGASGRALAEGGSVPTFNPLSIMAVADTRLDFSYSRSFVTALLGTDDPDIDRIPLPVLVSVMRERNDWHPKLAICTQKETVSLCIQGDKRRGPSWQDVKWSESNKSLLVCLPHGYTLEVQLHDSEFRPLFNLYNHTFRVQSSLLPLANESLAYETSLTDFQYKDSRSPPAFPSERVKRCRIRIFAKVETKYEASGECKVYRGFRILAVTSPKNRVLGSVSHDIGMRYPTLISDLQDSVNPGAPAKVLYVQEDRRQSSLLMVFNNEQDSRMLLDTLNSFVLLQGESQVAAVRLKGLSIESSDQAEAFSSSSRNGLAQLRWQEVLTLSKDPETPSSGFDSLTPPANLRIVAQAGEGTLTDRMTIGPGELSVRLSPDGNPNLTVYRSAQETLSITLDPSKAPQQLPGDVADVQRTAFMLPTIRTFSFYRLEDLHTFQASITSFRVAYDGLAQAFTIARRRPVTALSRHKKLEAGTTRLQIVSHERQRVVQLLAFFDDMPQADALNFQLKGVDEFERYDDKHSRGRYGVKLVDAKFTLPVKEKPDKEDRGSRSATPDGTLRPRNAEKMFVNLDVLDPPAENDDIVIGFESEQEREKFLDALPAPPQAHRGLTIRRRI